MLKRLFTLLIALAVLGCCHAQIAVRSSLTQIHPVRGGERVAGAIRLENLGDDETQVRIYQTDYMFQSDGTIDYGDPGTSERSNADWIRLSQNLLNLPAGESSEVTYVIDVPTGVRNGSYWSMIMIEENATQEQASGAVSVSTLLRYGVQVVTDFPGGKALLEFVNPQLENGDDGTVALTVDVVNTGEVLLRSDYYLELFDSAGERVSRVDGESLRTYPGTSIRQSFDLGERPSGAYTALVVSDSGADRLFGAQYQLELDGHE